MLRSLPASDLKRRDEPVYDDFIHVLEKAILTEMPVKKTFSGVSLRFVGGAGMGVLIAAVSFSAGYSSRLSIFQISFAGLVVIASGVMSCLLGDRLLDSVSKTPREALGNKVLSAAEISNTALGP